MLRCTMPPMLLLLCRCFDGCHAHVSIHSSLFSCFLCMLPSPMQLSHSPAHSVLFQLLRLTIPPSNMLRCSNIITAHLKYSFEFNVSIVSLKLWCCMFDPNVFCIRLFFLNDSLHQFAVKVTNFSCIRGVVFVPVHFTCTW